MRPSGQYLLDVSREIRRWNYPNVFEQDLRAAPTNDAEKGVLRIGPLKGDLKSKPVSVKPKR